MRKLPREAISCFVISIIASTHVEVPAQGAVSPSFSRQIQAILDANVGKRSAEASMNLIEPGSPDSSYLFHKVNGTHLKANGQGARMPLGGALEAADIEAIRLWILGGAKNN